MDKQNIKKALREYTEKYILINNQYDREKNITEEMDENYNRRFERLVDKFIEEISGPVLKLVEEKSVSVYEYKDNFCVEVNKNENNYSAWLYLKRSNFNFPKMFLVTWENETEEDFLTNLLEYLNNTDDIQTYKELYVCEDEWGE